ncbi:hypothetical protein F503_07559 [Ophiostoma piceae UAMH 11346]|uniref:Maintenance of telomere capping protein 1 n=1 Tax=Ophiostoma piceae (strain UAMH 11346) TaxID=1262450 RepID=S3CT02_OPHP1|nr:hypothetical protein F503_07559 [Ophiostoma piceae UAMH 11346]
MATKRSKNAATDDLDELFEGIGGKGDKSAAPKKTPASKAKAKAKASPSEKDILAELENELDESKPQTSRPHTPRIRETVAAAALPRRSFEGSKLSSARTSEDHPTPATTDSAVTSVPSNAGSSPNAGAVGGGGGGGWWGGFLSTASAAMKQAEAAVKQAEAAVKEIQQNEEAKKWADQVRGNVSALRGYGDDLAHRALLPTFTNILHTLAPPISSHERLLIHITHDMVGYPSMDPLVHGVFSRVMSQVEGGDLLVIQRGQESQLSTAGELSGTVSAAGWQDGPWWRVVDSPRDLGIVPGLHEGTKLCRASAEGYSNEYYAAHYGADVVASDATNADKAKAGLEVARQRAVEPVSESNPVRRSDLFLAIQAISTSADENNLFAGSAADAKEKEDAGATDEADESDDLVSFAVYILDPVHGIVYHTAAVKAQKAARKEAKASRPEQDSHYASIPEDIRPIVEGGGVDPREWVADWIEETLSLAVGVVAQRYVARRMGVGEGSAVKGKRRMDTVLEAGGGEAARAGLI